jgi:hypothetical protein
VKDALERLVEDLKQWSLEEELVKEMSAPLDAFVAVLDSETEPVRVAALLPRARRLVDALGTALRNEVEKRAPKTPVTPGEPQKPVRETRRVRFADVATVRRVRTDDEWKELQKKLDERVRALLHDFDVEVD